MVSDERRMLFAEKANFARCIAHVIDEGDRGSEPGVAREIAEIYSSIPRSTSNRSIFIEREQRDFHNEFRKACSGPQK